MRRSSHANTDGFVVEFVGRAGVGKTTIARLCEARLRTLGVPVFDVLGWSIPIGSRLQPRSITTTLRLVSALRVPLSTVAARLTIALYKELVKLSYSRANPGVVIFDQGLFQKLESLRRLCPPLDGREPALASSMRRARMPDLLVEVVAEPATLAQRRTVLRRDATSEEVERAWLATSTTATDVERLRRGMGDDPRPEHLMVRNEVPDDVEAVVDRLTRHIQAAWNAKSASVGLTAVHDANGTSFVSSRGS